MTGGTTSYSVTVESEDDTEDEGKHIVHHDAQENGQGGGDHGDKEKVC